MNRLMKTPLFTLIVAFAAGCSSKTGGLGSTDASIASDATVGMDATAAMDAASMDVGPPPARRLVDVKLFGDMPLDNAVLDPQFDQSAGNWFAIGGLASNMPRGVRLLWHEYPRTPMSMPVFELQNRPQDPPDAYVMGSVMSVPSPLSASVWIGRAMADSAALTQAKPSLIATLAASGDQRSFDLVPDMSTPQMTLDQFVWQRYAGMVDQTTVGIVTIVFQDGADKKMLIHGPVVQPMHQLPAGHATLGGRRLTEGEAKALQAMNEWRHRQIAPTKPAKPKL
jgi:hypothetical protein